MEKGMNKQNNKRSGQKAVREISGRLLKRGLTGSFAGLMVYGLLVNPSFAVDQVTGLSQEDFFSILVLFCLLSLGLVVWSVWDRRRLQSSISKRNARSERLSRLMECRNEVFIMWDAKGVLVESVGVSEWFGLEGKFKTLESLKDADTGLSETQATYISERVTDLFHKKENFTSYLFLEKSHRNIVVTGQWIDLDSKIESQAEEQQDIQDILDIKDVMGAVVWFRNTTLEENIAAHREVDLQKANTRAQQFQQSADLVSFPLWIRYDDLSLSWVNNAYVKAVEGENRVEVIAKEKELVSSSVGKAAKDLAMAAKSDKSPNMEKHFVVISGERRAVEIHNMPFERGDGTYGYLGYALDITELEKAKGELIHHTEAHSETLNKLSTAVAIFGSDKRLDYYNSAFSRLWKLPEHMLLEHPHHGEVLEAMREARRLPEQANFPEWKTQQLSVYMEVPEPVEEMWHLPDNTTLRVVSQPHPLGGLLVFYEDVTDYLALEVSYNTLFAVQRETLNNLHEGVAVFGIDGCLQLYNQAFAEIWQLSDTQLDNSPHTAEIMEDCKTLFKDQGEMEKISTLIAGGAAKKEITSGRLTRTDSSVIDYSAVPLPDGGMLMTYIDVSDSFRIEKALRERNLALEATDKIKTDFLAHMSYELRNPLNSIIGFSELLDKEYQGPLNDVQHEYMHSILSASGQLLELINDILDLSVIEAGGMTLDVTVIDLPSILKQVYRQLEERIKLKELEVNIDCPDEMEMITGDAKRIQHTIYNLLSNAVKFTHAGGRVTLGVKQQENHYNIFVRDSGVGIRPEEVKKVFEKFFTGSNVPNGQGAGLGLSLVKSFVELHGGEVSIDSTIEVGTTVNCHLPVHTEQEVILQ